MVVEINKLGRVSVIDLEDTTGVDLFHVEKQAQHIVSHDSSLMLINGEIISNWYWDNIAEDINERLQECSQIALAEIAAQFQVGSELLVSVLEPRLGNLVKGRFEGGQLYTPAYVARVNAMVRGAARGLTVPTNLSALWNSLQLLLQEMDGTSGVAVEGIEDPETVLVSLANHLRPMLINSWKEKRKLSLTGNVQKMKQLLDNLQRNLDESFLNMQLYEKALDLFEDDPSTSVLLHRHLLRSTGSPMVDTLLRDLNMHTKLKNGVDVEELPNLEFASLSSAERIAIAKTFPGSLSVKAVAVVEALEGKRVDAFMVAFKEIVEESGLTLKKLDKKLDRTLLHSYRKDLTSQVSAETDPISILPKVVSLLYIQVYSRALQAPGRAISVAVSRLKDKLDDSSYKVLLDYHSATVTLLQLISAATGSEEDCSSDRILSKTEVLESLMPGLKGLVLRPS